MTELSAVFRKPFPEALAALRLRIANLVPTEGWDDPHIREADHDRGFMVAGAMKADLLADLAVAVEKIESQGATLDMFAKDWRGIVAKHGWSYTGDATAKGQAWRIRTVYGTNLRTSYMSGVMAQLVASDYPWWVYRHGGSVEPRIQHLAWNGVALPPDHPFWQTHTPPNGWGCSCYVNGARTEAGIRRMGGDPAKTLPDGWQALDPKTGAPVGIDRGWAYSPGASVRRTLIAISEKVAALPAPIGADMIAAWPERLHEAWADAFGDFVDQILTGPPRGKLMVVGAMRPEWVKAVTAEGFRPVTAEIAVRDQDVWHTFRDAKKAQLDPAWYRRLPVHLRSPQAVILDISDPERPTLLLIYPATDKAAKLVVAVNYKVKKAGVMNIVESGRLVDITAIESAIRNGAKLITGEL